MDKRTQEQVVSAKKVKKQAKAQPKKKVWGQNIDANKTVKRIRHEKRMVKQAEKVLKVPHGTARARNMPQRVKRRDEHKADRAVRQNYWAGLAEQFKQAERQRRIEEKRSAT